MEHSHQTIKQAILDHCRETGIGFDDFRQIWAVQINEYPAMFDSFFDTPFSEISEAARAARVELLIDIFTG